LTRVLQCGIVAVIRAQRGEQLVEVARALHAGGVDVMEVTFTVPRAAHVLECVADELGDQILLGAGTVLDSETARTAFLAGAEFIVSPNTDAKVIRLCRRYGKLAMPGAFTPTEVVRAFEAGADVVKVFPCDVGGPGYLKALHGPLPHIPLMPTGGISLENAAAYLQAGACALGVGGSLVEAKTVEQRDFTRIEELARRFRAVVTTFAAGSGTQKL
jgi:2-dehydro-3-deoxyphosphogluconate aldolase/(4S)-4-hydroxy-2-oxoglutarate aldolase